MLNISKISKMLLISGLVLAFSCVTFDMSIAYADNGDKCQQEKKKIDEAKKKAEKEQKKAQDKTKDAQKAVNKAKENCKVALDYCSEYQSAKSSYDAAVRAETDAKKKSDADIKKMTEDLANSGYCKSKTTSEGEGTVQEKNSKKDDEKKEKSKEVDEKASNTKAKAEQEKAELEAEKAKVKNQEKKVNDAKDTMVKACSSDPNSATCQQAQSDYAEEAKALEAAAAAEKENVKKAQKEADKAQKEADKAQKKVDKEEKKAQKAVDNAQKDVDKYCALGHKSYNEKKCQSAKDELATAKADSRYQEMTKGDREKAEKEAAKAEAKAAADKESKSAEIDSIKGDINEASQNYVSDADLIAMQGDLASANAKLTAANKKVNDLEAEQLVACSKPKSKECRKANEALEAAKAEQKVAERNQKTVSDNYDHSKAKNKAAKDAIASQCSTEEQKSSADCAYALKSMRDQELSDTEKNLKAAEAKEAQSKARLDAATREYNEALERKAIACQNPTSDACASATKALKEAEEAKELAQIELDLAEANKVAYEVARDNAQSAAEDAQKGADAADQAAAEKAAADAKAQRQAEADKICAEHGERSRLCLDAKARVEHPDGSKQYVIDVVDTEAIEGFKYSSANGDVFEMVTRRAAMIILSIKPIVYIFAGFGLIVFAWGAIFNKISWKHFANIAIGLFLVANMGQLIEYFVTTGDEGEYYIGQWQSKTPKKDASNELSAAFRDTYTIYGEVLVDIPKQEMVENVEHTPAASNIAVKSNSGEESTAQEEMKKRGYCQGTGSFWSSLKSCVGDVTGSINKAAKAVKTTVATVKHVKNRVEDIKAAKEDISKAFDKIGEGGFSNVMEGVGTVLSNLDNIDRQVDSTVDGVAHGVGVVAENTLTIGEANENPSGKITTNLGGAVSGINNTYNVLGSSKSKR